MDPVQLQNIFTYHAPFGTGHATRAFAIAKMLAEIISRLSQPRRRSR
jgi:hypothetical protein